MKMFSKHFGVFYRAMHFMKSYMNLVDISIVNLKIYCVKVAL